MTTPDERPFSRMVTIARICDRAQKIVRALYRRHEWSDTMMSFPSVSAHFGWSCKDGGALAAVRVRMMEDGQRCFRHASELVDLVNGVDECIEDETRSPLGLSTAAAAELRDMQRWLVEEALKEPSRADPVCLPEPLKIRTVTKGPALRYTALAAVQKVMWGQLSCDPRFCVAAPMDGRTVMRLLGSLRPGNKWLSGDYKAATDNLAIEISYCVANEIADCTGMDASYRRLLVDGLVGHDYWLGEDENGEDLGYRAQARGQLMGSPVSFPVLCIANAAVIWDSVFPNQEWRDVEMIINGDDCLFQCDEAGRLRWQETAADVGLTPSVGKTYFHDRWAVINSALFDTSRVLRETQHFEVPGLGWAEDDGPMEYWEAPYLNLGLLLGLKRSGGQSSTGDGDVTEWRRADWDGDTSVGSRAHALVKGWTDGREELLVLFEECNQHLLDGDFGRPYYVPSEVGGWGLPRRAGQSLDCQDMLATIARIRRDYDTQVRVKQSLARSEYCVARERLLSLRPRTARRTGFTMGKFQMSSVRPLFGWRGWRPVPTALETTMQKCCQWLDRECGVLRAVEGRYRSGLLHKVISEGVCSGCLEKYTNRQVRELSPFWNRMRTVGQAMALSGELDVLTEGGEIDDKKVEELYYHSLSNCLVQEEPASDVLPGAWGVDGNGHIIGDSSFPNWGAHPPPVTDGVWDQAPVEAIELGHVLA